MAEPVRARRLTDQEGQRLQQIVRRGKHGSVRVRRAMIIMPSASGTLVRDALDLPGRVAEQLMSKVGQGPRGRDLLPDLGDLPVAGVTAGKAVAGHASAVPGQPRLGPGLPVVLVQ